MTLRNARRLILGIVLLVASISAAPRPGIAQATGGTRKTIDVPAVVSPSLNSDAREVRQQLSGMFDQYPPSVRQVLQLDPTLLSNANYLSLYPALAAFIAQHPEIAHNPAYFVGTRNSNNAYDSIPESWGRNLERIVTPIVVASVFVGFIFIVGWIIRAIMNHRRWLRVSKLQTDMQNKLLERFTSNEEMLAFIQTSAGQRFLESASVVTEPGPRALSAPVGRMLWSIQLGIVILVAGVGLEFVSYQLSSSEEAVTGFQVAGGIVIALGVGFILSALGSYVLSRRLGLLDPAPAPSVK